ncbi:MAG: glycolate oxidase subunit GlcF [Pseudomonadales bacterium]|jgi:glycolate oxidase iron-sulfur subunit|nr:glycolate oxidase subunit GlcF [Pseudomonadales bacterium]MDP4639667.1 glycolate oxidase subunit GlcF [Pseudomonadales bacterium]MDP4912049.1 glycolate oxidase subunit GlcF [Pseudomonadales bacterium]
MQTNIHPQLARRADIIEADEILRSCVHCGFCTATCPTYQLSSDELDGPRGRIYLIKNLLEDNAIEADSVVHLDRCLTCRACETTCPSGVRYGRLLDIGKGLIAEKQVSSSWLRRLLIPLLRLVVPQPRLFRPLLQMGNLLRPLLPGVIRRHVPVLVNKSYVLPAIVASAPRVLVLQGCVQKAATPQVNQALAVLLAQQGVAVEFLPEESCCGSLDYHLAAHDAARSRMRRLIDQLYPRLSEVQAVVSTASGCGVTLKEYTEIFADDPIYLAKAHQLHAKLRDVSELLASFTFSCLPGRVAFHSPCTLQHGQKINGVVEDILRRAGFALCAVQDAHLCCGSAGTYSLLQADISQTLLANKVTRLQAEQPDVIATANIGCQLHLQSGAAVPVVHWVELLADRLQAQPFKAVG